MISEVDELLSEDGASGGYNGDGACKEGGWGWVERACAASCERSVSNLLVLESLR